MSADVLVIRDVALPEENERRQARQLARLQPLVHPPQLGKSQWQPYEPGAREKPA